MDWPRMPRHRSRREWKGVFALIDIMEQWMDGCPPGAHSACPPPSSTFASLRRAPPALTGLRRPPTYSPDRPERIAVRSVSASHLDQARLNSRPHLERLAKSLFPGVHVGQSMSDRLGAPRRIRPHEVLGLSGVGGSCLGMQEGIFVLRRVVSHPSACVIRHLRVLIIGQPR